MNEKPVVTYMLIPLFEDGTVGAPRDNDDWGPSGPWLDKHGLGVDFESPGDGTFRIIFREKR